MESTPGSPSVVAKLMGLDESPQQQPVKKRRRVLSENYFRRVASIGVREKCHPLKLVVDHQDYKDVFQFVSPVKRDTDSNLSVHHGTKKLGMLELKTEVSRQVELQASTEKYEFLGEVGLNVLHKFSMSPLKTNKKGCSRSSGDVVLEPNYGRARNSARAGSPMRSLEAYQLVVEKPIIRDLHAMPVQEIGTRNLDYELGLQFRPRKKATRHDLKDLDLSKFRKDQDRYEALCSEWPFTPKRSFNWAKSRSSEYKVTHKDGSRPIKLRADNKKSQCIHSLESEGNLTVENTYVDHNDLRNEVVKKDSNAKDTSVQKETSMKDDEESICPLHCVTASDCMASREEIYQPSPVSVLDPLFRRETTSSSEGLERINVDTSEYSDTCSEGSGMILSSDDDSNERSVSDVKENYLVGIYKVEESRDFSYLIDVLMEAGFYTRGVEMDCDTWCFEECPMSLCVFESLEKKFGDQVSWNRSDRRLLFDRINDGLIEILQPSMGELIWKKPVSKRIRSQCGQEMIEEDLWMLLVSQEKEGREARKNLEEKLLRSGIGKLDLGDEIDFIGREVEGLLINELLEEFVSNLAESLKQH